MPPMTDGSPLDDVGDVGGVWLMQGTGMLLAIEARDPARGAPAGRPGSPRTRSRRPGHGLAGCRGDPDPRERPGGGRVQLPGGPSTTMTGVVVTDLAFEAGGAVESVCTSATLTGPWIRVAAR